MSTVCASATKDVAFLAGISEMGLLIQSHDWSGSALGPIEQWSQALRTTVSLCLASNFPINIIWGPEHIQIYNDGYRIVCGDKHPAALGMNYTECWASAWPAIGAPFEHALNGETSFLENQRMFLFRNGYLEETFFTFSLSPIRDETGGIGGLFHPVTETTATMIGERRTRAVRDLSSRLGAATTQAEVFRVANDTLAQFDFDLPFVWLYELDPDRADTYRLARSSGIAGVSPVNPPTISLAEPAIWPVQALLAGTATIELSDFAAHLNGLPCGPYEEPPAIAFASAIRHPGVNRPVALCMAGASPRLPMDDVYRGFYDVVSAAIGAALSRVILAEAERQRTDALAAIDRAKTVFFSNVSHEFRTPLTLMLGPLEEALEQQDLAPTLRTHLEIANRNTLRLLKLVNSLLDFSRLEAGRNEAKFVPLDLSAVTTELASNFRSACMRAGPELTVTSEHLKEPVWVDPDMWERIVLNLISNAFKFTFTGGIEVTLREHEGRARLIVRDSGVGVPANELPLIFDRFHRVENQRGRSVEGTGIGLSLVRDLVHLHGGEIDVESIEGEGSTFSITLPFGNSHLPADRLHASPDAPDQFMTSSSYVEEALRWLPDDRLAAAAPADPALARAAGATPTVLIADDNADMRAYVRRVLEEGGYHVETVDNGRAALDALRRGPLPDLLLTDVMMPELDGFALLDAVRRDQRSRDLAVILLSARAGGEAKVEALAAGADDYLVKPFNARELKARIDGAVTLARQRAASAERERVLQLEIETARTASAVRTSEAQVASLFEQTAAGVAETDLEGRLIRANPRFCEIVGRSCEALIGMERTPLIHPEEVEENRARIARMVETGLAFESDGRYIKPDGSTVWVTKAVTPIRAGDGKTITSILGVVLDISFRKKAEQDLQTASARKDDFLAMLAHELRNPLAPITAAAELMTMGRLDDTRLRQTSSIIMRQVRHMTGLVDDLLDVSRVTRGLVSIEHQELDLKSVVWNAVEQVRPLIETNRHHLTIDLPSAPSHVSGDQKRLVQVFTNLLNNAAKYTPQGGNIELRLEVRDEDIQLFVTDNGIGISEELQPYVFDLFAQAQRTPDRSQGGLGLGLALVKSIIALHGGWVACTSEGQGEGSTFIVALPRLLTAADECAVPIIARPESKKSLPLMVVDDNVDAATILGMLLESHGYSIIIEHDPHLALARARSERPRVCVLDIGLPGMDGNELARRLRRQPETEHALLIALTGYGQQQDRQTALDAGFDHFFAKPVDISQLIGVLNDFAMK